MIGDYMHTCMCYCTIPPRLQVLFALSKAGLLRTLFNNEDPGVLWDVYEYTQAWGTFFLRPIGLSRLWSGELIVQCSPDHERLRGYFSK